jgi:hypothetical protein
MAIIPELPLIIAVSEGNSEGGESTVFLVPVIMIKPHG